MQANESSNFFILHQRAPPPPYQLLMAAFQLVTNVKFMNGHHDIHEWKLETRNVLGGSNTSSQFVVITMESIIHRIVINISSTGNDKYTAGWQVLALTQIWNAVVGPMFLHPFICHCLKENKCTHVTLGKAIIRLHVIYKMTQYEYLHTFNSHPCMTDYSYPSLSMLHFHSPRLHHHPLCRSFSIIVLCCVCAMRHC